MDKFLGWLIIVCGLVTFSHMIWLNDFTMWALIQGLFLVVVGGYLLVKHPPRPSRSKSRK